MITLDQLAEIFQHQTHLARKFHPHELMNGYTPPTWPVNLQTRHGQDRLRQFAWWITEEFAEFMSAPKEDKPEELADMLHFAVEIQLNCGFTAADTLQHSIPEEYTQAHQPLDALVELGRAMNLLKKKPWKLEPKDTDPETFKFHLTRSLYWLLHAFDNLGYHAYDLYFQKKKINEQRIADGV